LTRHGNRGSAEGNGDSVKPSNAGDATYLIWPDIPSSATTKGKKEDANIIVHLYFSSVVKDA
jgi:hypothetical protein